MLIFGINAWLLAPSPHINNWLASNFCRRSNSPHMSAGRLQTDVAAVLEGGRVARQHRLLADHAAPPHRLQRPRQREDAPVPLAQLHGLRTQVLQPDAVPPLNVTYSILFAIITSSLCDPTKGL